jgi:hypothetical protein
VLLGLVLLVSHDRIMLDRLAHGTREKHGCGIGLSLRHLLSRRSSSLPSYPQRLVNMAVRCPGCPIRNVAIDLRLVEELVVIGGLWWLLWGVCLRLVRRRIMRSRRLFILLCRVRRRKPGVASKTSLGEVEGVAVGAGGPQCRHGGRRA